MDTHNIQSALLGLEKVIQFKFVHQLIATLGVKQQFADRIYTDFDLGKFKLMLDPVYWTAAATRGIPPNLAQLYTDFLIEKKQKIKACLFPGILREMSTKERFKKLYEALMQI